MSVSDCPSLSFFAVCFPSVLHTPWRLNEAPSAAAAVALARWSFASLDIALLQLHRLSVVSSRCHWSSSLLTVLFLFFLLHDHSEFFLFYFCCIFGARFEDYWLLAPNWLCCRWLLLLANKWTDAITIKRLGRWLCIDWFLLLFFIFFFAVASLIGRVPFFCFSLLVCAWHMAPWLSLSPSASLSQLPVR